MKVIAAVVVFSAVTLAQPAFSKPGCSSFSDPTARLACYDATNKPKAEPAKMSKEAPGIPATPEQMALGSKFDKAFLQAGINTAVMVVTKGQKGIGATFNVPYPNLLFFGYLNRAAVYKIVTTLDVINEARKAQFKTVEFNSRGTDGVWIFDVRQDGRVCARDLCF